MVNYDWTGQHEESAVLVAAGELTYDAIAKKVGVEVRTLWRWRQTPEFAARVAEVLADFREEVRRRGLASRERRIRALNDRWNRLQRVIEERADDPQMATVPGGQTGLIVHNVKGVGKGEDFQLIDLYEVDTALLAEIRAHEKQAAQELGQAVDKHQFDFSTHTNDDLIRRAIADPVIQRAIGVTRGDWAKGADSPASSG